MHQGFDIGDMRQGQQLVTVDLLIMRHVAGNDGQARVHLTKEGLRLDYLGNGTGGGEEFVKGAGLGFVQRHTQADFDRIAQGRPIDYSAHGANDASLAHLVDTARQRGGRDPCPVSQIGGGQIGGGLKLAQDSEIGGIKHEISVYLKI